MSRLSTCKKCGKKLQPDEKNIHGNKTYCKECFEKIEQESNEYKSLMEFICENYKLDKPTGLMLKQIKEFKEEYGYNYAAMTYTLWYCKEILNKSLIEKYGVVLIKYFYENAKDYYMQQEKMKNQMDEISNVEVKTKIVKKNNIVSKNSKTSLINLESLLEGGDAY